MFGGPDGGRGVGRKFCAMKCCILGGCAGNGGGEVDLAFLLSATLFGDACESSDDGSMSEPPCDGVCGAISAIHSGTGGVFGGHLEDFTGPLLFLALGTSFFASGGSSGTCFAFEPLAELPICVSTTSSGKVSLIKFTRSARFRDTSSGSIAVRIHLQGRTKKV